MKKESTMEEYTNRKNERRMRKRQENEGKIKG
jgi:hypothetical protein